MLYLNVAEHRWFGKIWVYWRKVERALNVDRACSDAMEELICTSIDDPLYLAQIPVPCLIVVASWFLWWERRQCAKGEKITMPDRSALSIQALALNFRQER